MTHGSFLAWAALALTISFPGSASGQPVTVKQAYVKASDCSIPRALMIRFNMTGNLEVAQALLRVDSIEVTRAGTGGQITACFDLLSGDPAGRDVAFVNLSFEARGLSKRVLLRIETPAQGPPVLYIEPEP